MARSFLLHAGHEALNETRADKLLALLFSEQEELKHLSRSQIQRLMETGQILVNGKPIRNKDKIQAQDEITLTLPEAIPLEANPENIPIHILYEDEHLIVINKQPGLTVHPSETQHSGTLVNALLYHVKDLSGIGGKLRPGIVHRIDKNTSGAIVISKHDQAHTGLAKLFATHDIDRKYWALTYGTPKINSHLRLETLIDRNPNDRKKMAVSETSGRTAISHFKLLEAYAVNGKHPFSGLIEATLETGRTHQVRVHLHHLGHSLLGDPVYGTPSESQPKWKSLPKIIQEAVSALPGQALHARVLGFQHPITGKKLHFEAEPFAEFSNLLSQLKTFC